MGVKGKLYKGKLSDNMKMSMLLRGYDWYIGVILMYNRFYFGDREKVMWMNKCKEQQRLIKDLKYHHSHIVGNIPHVKLYIIVNL